MRTSDKIMLGRAETILQRYDSLDELAETCIEMIPRFRQLSSEKFLTHPFLSADWIGRHFPNIPKVREAVNERWDDGMAIYDKMADELRDARLLPPKPLRRTRKWSEDDGDEVDIERLRKGQPFWNSSHRAHRPGPMTVTILSNMSTSCGVSSSRILWRGAATIALAELLEAADYRVEIWAVNRIGSPFESSWNELSNNCITAVNLKRPSDPLDTSTLINAVSGWSFRTLFLGSLYLENRPIRQGHGSPNLISREAAGAITPDEQALICDEVWSYNQAIGWVKQQLERFNNDHV